MKRQRTESFSPENKGMEVPNLKPQESPDNFAVVTSSRNFEYGHGNTNWMATDASPSTKTQPDVPQSFWRVNAQDSPLTPAFSPFTPSLQIPPSQTWPTPHTEASPRDDLSWSVPQRSISYSNLEGLHSQHHYAPYANAPSHPGAGDYTSKPRVLHSMYPPPISTSGGGISAPETTSATSEPSHHPQSAGALPPYQGSWQQPYSYPKPPSSASDHYGGWSAPHGQLPLPAETGHVGAPAYGYGEQGSGMYYPAPPHPGR
jgi:hypothetical protein